MMSHGPLQLIPLYALDALPVSERVEVDSHLDSCPVCVEDLGQYLVAVASLTADQAAPRHVWERIAASIEADSAPSYHRTELIDRRSRRRGRQWRAVNRLVPLVALAAVVLGIVAGGSYFDRATSDSIVALAKQAATQPEAHLGEFLVGGVPVAEVILTHTGEGYFIPTDRLPSLDPSSTYQLWVLTADESVISGGVLGNEPRPSAFTWDGPISGFALTREVNGGVTVSAGDVVAVVTDG